MFSKRTKIFGIIGYPLGHTLSPWIHNTLFSLAKFDGVYLVFEKPNWYEVGLSPLQELGIQGLSVTIPYKEWAYTQSQTQCQASIQMKASNTLLFGSSIHAENTDGSGALKSIQLADADLINPFEKKSILILGSGGSAKGIAFALSEHLQNKANGKPILRNISILARNRMATESMLISLGNKSYIKSISESECMEQNENFDLIIHTTPVGMKTVGGKPLLDKNFFTKKQTLFDIVYNPLETELVKLAKKKKTNIIPGYKMLLHQGIRQFELFTGLEAKNKWIEKIESILYRELKKHQS
ncbi:shikimate dehydrogenase [Leptospira sp. 96542]|nr:shikimate dehydrogenase [Leptospira sp. 96542]